MAFAEVVRVAACGPAGRRHGQYGRVTGRRPRPVHGAALAPSPTTGPHGDAPSSPQRPLDTIAGPVAGEYEAKGSRFHATLAPVADEDGAAEVIAEARTRFPDARHHCSAWVLGVTGQRQRPNDDGEPGGTAGAPMLAVLTGAGLSEVVAVVSRTFGGTLLGAGGLVRAYSAATSAAVTAAERVRRVPVVRVRVEVGHADAGRIEHHLHRATDALQLTVTAGAYGVHGAAFEVVLPAEDGLAGLDRLLAGDPAAVALTELGRELRALPISG